MLLFLLQLCEKKNCSFAQNVGINVLGLSPNTAALLDIDANPNFNKGLLIPRVTFLQRTGANFNPLSTAAQGLTVYQTDAGGLGEGFYFNTSTSTTPAWSFLLNNTSGWSLTGNAATTPSSSAIGAAIPAGQNYAGTSDLKDFVLATNNLERLRISSAGNIGIGTTSPNNKLHIVGGMTVSSGGTWPGDGNAMLDYIGLRVGHDGATNSSSPVGLNIAINRAAPAAAFKNSTGPALLVEAGSIGIGTTTPSTQLHSTGGVRFQTLTGTGNRFVITDLNGNISAGSATTSGIVTGSGILNYVPKWTPDGATLGNSLIFDNGTYVGIGTTNPATSLDINGQVQISGVNNLTPPSGLSYGIWAQNSRGLGIYSIAGGASQGIGIWTNKSGTTPTEVITILRDGNLGIGTTSPAQKLDVVGSAKIGNIVYGAATAGSGDAFVIGNDTKLTDIDVANTTALYGLQDNTVAALRFGSSVNTFITSIAGSNSYFNNGGNVGIGTASPAAKFTVAGDATSGGGTVQTLLVTGNNGAITINSTSAHAYQTFAQGGVAKFEMGIVPTSSDFYLNPNTQVGSNGAAIYILKSTGNVGIGTLSPGAKLHVEAGKIYGSKTSFPNPNSYSDADLVLGSNADTRNGYGGTNGSHIFLRSSDKSSITALDENENLGQIAYQNLVWTIGENVGWGTQTIKLPNLAGTGNRFVVTDLNGNLSAGSGTGAGIVTGSGTLNYVPKWTPNGTTLGNSSIFDNGNVGIATTGPGEKLDVSGKIRSSAGFVFNAGDGTPWWITGTGNGPALMMQQHTGLGGPSNRRGSLGWMDNNSVKSEFLAWSDAGNIGIGTLSPTAKLEVYNGDILIQGGTGGTSNKIIFKTADNGDLAKYMGTESYWTVIGAHGNEGWRFKDNSGDIIMQINGLGGNNGNVGIGTTSPGNKLHVYAKNNEGILIGTPYYDSENTRKNSIDFLAWRDTYDGNNVYVGASISTQRVWTCCGGWPSGGYPGIAQTDLIISTRNSADISVPPAERIRVTYDGNVGIGTSSPGAKLEIAGQIKITGGSPGAGKVLTSDAAGLATWNTAASGSGDNLGNHIATTTLNMNNNNISNGGNINGTIFIDQNDASYSVDPASTSNLNLITNRTRATMGNSALYNTPRHQITANTNYWTGAMGWGTTDFNTIFSNWGSGFFDTWSSPTNAPGGSSHYVGLQGFHHSYQDGTNAHGFQMAMAGEADNRFFWRSGWPSPRAWVEMIHTGNLNSLGSQIFIPNNGSGDWQIASNSNATSYSQSSLELRESNFTGNSSATPPRLGFHWGGVVASQIAIEANGRIAIRDNPGTGYENFIARDISGSIFIDQNDASYSVDPASTSNLNLITNRTRATMGNSGLYNTPRHQITANTNYWTGAMGWGTTDFNTIFSNWGSGFFDTWSSPTNAPGGSSHYVGLQGFHHSYQDGTNAHGFQMAMAGEADNRFFWRSGWPSPRAWVEMIHTGNLNSLGSQIFIPNNVSGDWQIASNSNATSYSQSSLELRETNFAGAGQQPPRLGFHWGGVVASQIGIEASGRIAIRNNPGTGYEQLIASNMYANDYYINCWGWLSNYFCSDLRYKKEIEPITNVLPMVLKLQGVKYNWRNDEFPTMHFDDKREIGIIAQDLEKIFPEIVNTNEEGYKSVDYGKLSPVLIEAIKELNTKYENQQKINEAQQKILENLKLEIDLLKKQNQK